MSSGQLGGSPTEINFSFLDRSHYFSFEKLLIYPHEADWTPFQVHCYAEILVAPGIEPRNSEGNCKRRDLGMQNVWPAQEGMDGKTRMKQTT
jgi:hypothetical protein